MAPRPGDILCLSGGEGNYGHVTIIMEVTKTYIKIGRASCRERV